MELQRGDRIELNTAIRGGGVELPAGTPGVVSDPSGERLQVCFRVGGKWTVWSVEPDKLRRQLSTGDKVRLRDGGRFVDIVTGAEKAVRAGTPGTVYGVYENGNALVRWDQDRAAIVAATAPEKITKEGTRSG